MGLCCSKNNLATVDSSQHSAMLVAISGPAESASLSEPARSSSELASAPTSQLKLPATKEKEAPKLSRLLEQAALMDGLTQAEMLNQIDGVPTSHKSSSSIEDKMPSSTLSFESVDSEYLGNATELSTILPTEPQVADPSDTLNEIQSAPANTTRISSGDTAPVDQGHSSTATPSYTGGGDTGGYSGGGTTSYTGGGDTGGYSGGGGGGCD